MVFLNKTVSLVLIYFGPLPVQTKCMLYFTYIFHKAPFYGSPVLLSVRVRVSASFASVGAVTAHEGSLAKRIKQSMFSLCIGIVSMDFYS